MERINVGDVVVIKSNKDIKMTVKSTSCVGGNIQCVYYNSSTQEFKLTPVLPPEVFIKEE